MGIHLKRAVFLDRDGVINHSIVRDGKPFPPHCVADTIIVEGAQSDLARLKQQNFFLAVVTNQPDVRRGSVARESIEEIHSFLRSKLPLDDFFVCYHDDVDGCNCRKPLPGLLLSASTKHQIDLRKSFLVGDRWRDIDAGAAAGCKTILIDYHYKERSSNSLPDVSVARLSEAVDWILNQEMETD